MVGTLPSNEGDAGSILGQGAKIPHVLWQKKKNINIKQKQTNKQKVTNSIKPLKMVHIRKKKKTSLTKKEFMKTKDDTHMKPPS